MINKPATAKPSGNKRSLTQLNLESDLVLDRVIDDDTSPRMLHDEEEHFADRKTSWPASSRSGSTPEIEAVAGFLDQQCAC